MSRCNSCFGIVTKNESECYVCGEAVPGARKAWYVRLFWTKPNARPAKSVSVTNKSQNAPKRFAIDNLFGAQTPLREQGAGHSRTKQSR